MLFIKNAIFRIIFSLFLFFYAALFLQTNSKESPSISCAKAFLLIGTWKLLDALQCIIRETEYIMIIQSLSYLLANAGTFTMFRIALQLEPSFKKQTQKNISNILVLFPILLSVVTITYMLFTNKSIFVVMQDTLTSTLVTPGYHLPKKPLYYIHSIYSYGMLTSSLIIFMIKAFKTFENLKKQYLILLIGTIIYLIPSLVRFTFENFQHDQYSYLTDFISEFSFFLTCSFFFYSFYFMDSQQLIRVFRTSFFESSHDIILIFNKEDKFLTANKKAQDFLYNHNIKPVVYTHQNKLLDTSDLQKFDIATPESEESYFYLSSNLEKKMYYCNKCDILSRNKKKIGSYIIIHSMEHYNSLIQQLEYNSSSDTLTGCKNASAFDKTIVKQYASQRSPIIIVAARIRNLNELNSTMGYVKTDTYIKQFATILKENVPEKTIIFRIGGSLFGFALPLSFETQITELFKNIKKSCSAFSKAKTNSLNCSLGYTIATSCANLSLALEKSYENMLLDKS